MAGQGPSRRELLQALTLASAASAFSGFSRWNYAFADSTSGSGHMHDAAPQDQPHAAYTPKFFAAAEYTQVEMLVDLILPALPSPAKQDTGLPVLMPGAKETGVAEFIDFMVFSDPKLQPPFHSGLSWLDHAAAPASSFAQLSPAKQTAVLDRLAYKAKHQQGEEAGQQFFLLLRKYTVMGFYTTRAGLESLDYPGLKFYSASPGCNHDGNPEHIGL